MSSLSKLHQTLFKFTYKLLGSSLSTRLSESYFGKLVARLISPNDNQLHIYSGLNGIKLKLTGNEAKNLGFLYLGVVNPHETSLIRKILKPKDIVIDIGTYIDGWHSLFASHIVGPHGQVHAFEPLYHERLKTNIEINGMKNIILNAKAVSDKVGAALFYDNEEASSLIKSNIKNVNSYKVKTTTLDTYVKSKKLKKVKLLKIDTEGAEEKVLKGAKKLLNRKDAPDILIEVIDELLEKAGSSRFKIMSFLKNAGYTPYAIGTEGKIEPLKKKADQTLNNLYFRKD